MAPKRQRFSGGERSLAAIIGPCVTSPGWLVYDECEQLSKARIDAKAILKHKELLANLRDVQANLAFGKNLVQKTFDMILGEKVAAGQEPWCSFDEAARDDWTVTMTRRLRAMCRTCTQGELRNPSSWWALRLPWREGADGGAQPSSSSRVSAGDEAREDLEEGEEEESEMEESPEGVVMKRPAAAYVYGYDTELGVAYRTLGVDGEKEIDLAGARR